MQLLVKPFTSIDDYIQKPLNERQSHLQLSDPCIEIGGTNSGEYRGLLAHYLGTQIPTGRRIFLCHACNNAKCSNPTHLYWGTDKENVADAIKAGTFKTIWERSVEKYGEEEARKLRHSGTSKGGKKGGGHNKCPPEQIEQYRLIFEKVEKTWGWRSRLADELGVSRMHIKRMYDLVSIP